MDETANLILDADLTSALQVTLLELHRRAEGGLFVGTQGDIAQARGVERGTVAKQMSTLVDRGWLEKVGSAWRITPAEEEVNEEDNQSTPRRESKQGVDSVNTPEKGFPSPPFVFPQESTFNPLSPSHLIPSQRGGGSGDPPSWWQGALKPIWEAEDLPDDHPARWDHQPGDWTFDFASAALEHLRSFELLASPTKRKLDRDGEDYVISQWADTFRLLHEQDGYSKKEIRETMEWLFDDDEDGEDNFWISTPAIQSVPPLRSKTRNGDAYKFDIMYQQASSESDGTNDRPARQDAKNNPEENWKRLARAAKSA